MTSTVPRPDVSAPAGSRGRRAKPRTARSRVRLVILLLLLVLLVAAAVWAWWLGTGLLNASRTVQDRAALAQAELQQFRDVLKTGDEAGAVTHLKAGETALGEAQQAAQASQVRTAKNLPWVGNTVDDLDHLLAAATILGRSGRDALTVYSKFSGENSQLFSNSRFSIPAIKEAQVSVAHIQESLDRATAELRQVHGKGPKGGDALAKKKLALTQIASSRQEIVSLAPLLTSLPSAVGAGKPTTYLVAIMNPAEMRASGGAPLSVAFIHFDHGKMSILAKGATSKLTNLNSEFYWNRLTGKADPFQSPAGEAQRFVNTTFNPNFAVSGEQMVRAIPANFGKKYKTDGVIALDITAIGHLLDTTGPIKTKFYGSITGANIAKKLVIKAYTFGSDDSAVNVRHNVNDKLMAVMLSRLTDGGGLIGKARSLGEAIPGRHLQLYFRDPGLQKVVVEKGMGGVIPVRDSGNLTAVYTQNGNGSKMDVFQRRTVSEKVQLRADGSALVTRTVALKNPTPPYNSTLPYADRKRGYDTRWATNLVINLMPKGSKITKQPQVERSDTKKGVEADGLTYAQAAVTMPPDSSTSISWQYVVPHAADVKGDHMYFRDYVVPQSMLIPPVLDLTVTAPDGWTAVAPEWKVSGSSVSTSVPMDRVQVLKVTLRRSS